MMTADGSLRILLAHEHRGENKSWLNFLGGKYKPGETRPAETASRKFCDETKHLVTLSSQTLAAAIDPEHPNTKVLWLPEGKYYLYVHLITHDRWLDLPERFLVAPSQPTAAVQTLGWLPLPMAVATARGKRSRMTWGAGSKIWTSSPSRFLAQALRGVEMARLLSELECRATQLTALPSHATRGPVPTAELDRRSSP